MKKENFIITKKDDVLINGKEFNFHDFKRKFESNKKELSKIQKAGWLEDGWNSITGKKSKVILNSLDVNNEFIRFSEIVYEALLYMGKESQNHRKIIEDKINSRQKAIVNTENILSQLIIEIETYTSELKGKVEELESINNSITEINKQNQKFSQIQNNLSQEIKSLNENNINLNDITRSLSFKNKKLKNDLISLNNDFKKMKFIFGLFVILTIIFTLYIINQ